MKDTWRFGILVTLTFAITSANLRVAGAQTESTPDDVTTDSPSSTTVEDETEAPSTTRSPEEEAICHDMIGMYIDGKWVGLEVKYNLKKVLEEYGGPPGKVNASWTEKKDPPLGNVTDVRPLPIADPEYWIYSYIDTDGETWARGEHAVHRFPGTPKEFLEIRGTILWTPKDFCGKARQAYYSVDDRGFTFEVTREYCWVYPKTFRCAWPARCEKSPDGTSITCAAAPYTGLLASLVGGG